ncbi:MAG: M20 family metallopeptidase [Haloferacaceae archaeon]
MTFDIETFHRRAVETPSHEDVSRMRTLLVDTLREAGVAPSVDDAGNVVASRGDGDGPHVVLNTHVDTVPPHVPYDRDGDVVYGRGACDAKGPLAAMVAAFLDVDDPAGPVTLAVTPDEETTQLGAAHLAESLSADAYVVGEPTGLDVCPAARGQFEGTVTLRGTSAHAADSGAGVNAVAAAAPVLDALAAYDDERGTETHPTLGRPSLTPTVIEGGRAPNQVPDECRITFDRRSVPPETSDSFRADLEAYLRDRLPDDIGLSVDLVRPDTPFPDAFSTDRDADLVRTLAAAAARVTGGRAGDVRPFGAATEASYFAPAPTVVFGPGVLADDEGAVAHADREYVRVDEVRRAAAALRRALASGTLAASG